jgi:hypothetical protein
VVPGHFAEKHFAERHFAERRFAERTFCRTDILPKDILPNGHFAERTFCRKDNLPKGQLAENRDVLSSKCLGLCLISQLCNSQPLCKITIIRLPRPQSLAIK